ncbi:microtubule associated protein (MAP65/ASE1) family protein [Wolffia australiana]
MEKLNGFTVMSSLSSEQLLQMETTCGSLLYELQTIWDEVGETEAERDRLLLEVEQECLEVYRRKVDLASKSRAQLRQAIADSEAELAAICSSMGERPVYLRQSNNKAGSLKEELNEVLPQLEEMRRRKSERWNQFIEVLEQIQKVTKEIRPGEFDPSNFSADESDLSTKKLEEFHRQLQCLQKEKSDRVKHVLDLLRILNSLCSVLGVDFKLTISQIHPSLEDITGPSTVSNETIERLENVISGLREVKLQRMQKVQDLATSMLELWNLMDTPAEEQQVFQNVTCNVAAAEEEITEPGTLSLDYINYVEAEVIRLEELKASKMKDLVFKKKAELDELRRRAHLLIESNGGVEFAVEAVESGAVDPCMILEQIENQISIAKDEAFSRREILEKVEKWIAACEEESWLEEYNRDDNRYNAGRGAHLTLKRAEKARAAVNKIPGMVEMLVSKTRAWERENGIPFKYDGVQLLSMLEEYTFLRQEKEQERKRQRDQKKLQDQLLAEQEALFGSKPSPSKNLSARKVPRTSTGGPTNRRLSLGGALLHPPKSTRSAKKPEDMLSAGRRGLDVAGLPAKKLAFGGAPQAKEAEAAPPRRPFAVLEVASMLSTPVKSAATLPPEEENNKTPAAAQLPVPKTPKTVSVPMQLAAAAAATATPLLVPAEDGEYSFEERRAGFLLSRAIYANEC